MFNVIFSRILDHFPFFASPCFPLWEKITVLIVANERDPQLTPVLCVHTYFLMNARISARWPQSERGRVKRGLGKYLKRGKRKASGDANCAMDEWRRPFREAFSRSKERSEKKVTTQPDAYRPPLRSFRRHVSSGENNVTTGVTKLSYAVITTRESSGILVSRDRDENAFSPFGRGKKFRWFNDELFSRVDPGNRNTGGA